MERTGISLLAGRHRLLVDALGNGELTTAECPAEVAEVIELGQEAERASDGAFSIKLPTAAPSVTVIAASLTWADIDATAA